ncbi:MAG TPA: universal stress protein, partial [Parasegetibacter sp.]
YKSQRAKMDNMLQGYSPDYRFIRLFDFTEAINQFILDEKIDVVIIVPRKHSFLKSLFRSSNTNQLAYHSFVPVLCISEP